jgi:hypothetical protein
MYLLYKAKLYHPDVKNDKYSHNHFSKLQNYYEKLKQYIEIREKLKEMEKNIDENGTIILEKTGNIFTQEESNNYQEERRDIIQKICKFIFLIY